MTTPTDTKTEKAPQGTCKGCGLPLAYPQEEKAGACESCQLKAHHRNLARRSKKV